ncbi:MAG TPA: SDR family NAD(P)-dependent oxidoreductase [Steroidobacteraceae bacterium]|nr:SDR family NAD(P)-dependent oxidoreductase [Steroidobacteraceae bacterium]
MKPPVVLVTGANRGLGCELARQILRRGATVILTSRREDAARAAAAAIAAEAAGGPGVGKIDYCRLDALEPQSIRRASDYLTGAYGRLDVLINNAGAHSVGDGAGLEVSASTCLEAFTNNCLGALQVTQTFVPLLSRTPGQVINVSTLLALPGMMAQLPGQYFAYRIAKAALNAMTAALAEELRPAGISVNAVHPGWLKTSMGGPYATDDVGTGANRVVSVAFDLPEQTTGKLFVNGAIHAW